MPIIFMPGCRVCGADKNKLKYDEKFNLYCTVCKDKEKEIMNDIKNFIKNKLNNVDK
jgi:hypothetical protein